MISDDTPLGAVRGWLRDQAKSGGASCPCCGQFSKVYKRKITSTMARALIRLYQVSGPGEYVHVPTALHDFGARGDELKLRYWGLLEELETERPDGSSRAGMWRVTDRGRAFVENRTEVPSHALVFDGRRLGFDGDFISIVDALGVKFSYSELMAPAVAS